MNPWSELERRRWVWSERSAAWLHRETFGDVEFATATDLARIMVVGDSQVGKTTLLTRMLGVKEPALSHVADVLRAGRPQGDSATPVPVQYRWSTHEDEWLIVSGSARQARWLTDGELQTELAALRSPNGDLTWQLQDRPLEIGLPTRMANIGSRQQGLRVLDLPGLAARNPRERAAARSMVARFAPLMNLVVFVQLADGMADGFNDLAIREDPVLSAWMTNPAAFRVVLTRAFTLETIRPELTRRAASPEPAERSAAGLAAFVTERLATQLAESLDSDLPGANLATMVHPVELGNSLREFSTAHPQLADLVESATAIVLDNLARAIDSAGRSDSHGLQTLDAAVRVADRVRRYTADWSRRVAHHDMAVAKARTEWATAMATLAQAERESGEEERWLRAARKAVADLSASTVTSERPSKPLMRGDLVRAMQEDERCAWTKAAGTAWASWRRDAVDKLKPCPFPTTASIDDVDLRRRYDKEVECCGRCTERAIARWFSHPPEHCYGKMTAAGEPVGRWIRGQLVQQATRSLQPGELRVANATARRNAAARESDSAQHTLAAAEANLAVIRERQHNEEARGSRYLQVVDDIRAVLERENEAHVAALLRQLGEAPDADRGWLAVAILRTLLDLQNTVGHS